LGDALIRTDLLKEAEELSAIFGRIINSARKSLNQ
jgi:hypothetical protein